MKENRGHARCNAFGLRYINSNENFDYTIYKWIVMVKIDQIEIKI